MLAFRVDDVGHLLGRREILGRKRLAQLREEAPLGSRHALPLRGDEPRGTQRFEQQRQQLIVGCLQRLRTLAGEQLFDLQAGDIANSVILITLQFFGDAELAVCVVSRLVPLRQKQGFADYCIVCFGR